MILFLAPNLWFQTRGFTKGLNTNLEKAGKWPSLFSERSRNVLAYQPPKKENQMLNHASRLTFVLPFKYRVLCVLEWIGTQFKTMTMWDWTLEKTCFSVFTPKLQCLLAILVWKHWYIQKYIFLFLHKLIYSFVSEQRLKLPKLCDNFWVRNY